MSFRLLNEKKPLVAFHSLKKSTLERGIVLSTFPRLSNGITDHQNIKRTRMTITLENFNLMMSCKRKENHHESKNT